MIQIDWMIGNTSRKIFRFPQHHQAERFRRPSVGEKVAMPELQYQGIFTDEVQVDDRTIDGQLLKGSVFCDFPAAKM